MGSNKSLIDAIKVAQGQALTGKAKATRRHPEVVFMERQEQIKNYDTNPKALVRIFNAGGGWAYQKAKSHPKFPLAQRVADLESYLNTPGYYHNNNAVTELGLVGDLLAHGVDSVEALKNPAITSALAGSILAQWREWEGGGGTWNEAMTEALVSHFWNFAQTGSEAQWKNERSKYYASIKKAQNTVEDSQRQAEKFFEITLAAAQLDTSGLSPRASKTWRAILDELLSWAVSAAESDLEVRDRSIRFRVADEEEAGPFMDAINGYLSSIAEILAAVGNGSVLQGREAKEFAALVDPSTSADELGRLAGKPLGTLFCTALIRHGNASASATAAASKKTLSMTTLAWEPSVTTSAQAQAILAGVGRDAAWVVLSEGSWQRTISEADYQEVLLDQAVKERSRNALDVSSRMESLKKLASDQTKEKLAEVCGGGVSALLAGDKDLSQKARIALSFNPDTMNDFHATNWLFVEEDTVKSMSSASLLAAWNIAKKGSAGVSDYGLEGLTDRVQPAIEYVAASGAPAEVVVTMLEKSGNLSLKDSLALIAEVTTGSEPSTPKVRKTAVRAKRDKPASVEIVK